MPHNYSLLIQSDPFWATSASSTPFNKLGWVMHIFTYTQILGAVRSGPGDQRAEWTTGSSVKKKKCKSGDLKQTHRASVGAQSCKC